MIVSGPARSDPLEAGNKFATLARLELAGHNVPPFFCIGASAFRSANGSSIPPALRSAVFSSLSKLGSERVAVRGCFVSTDGAGGEDSARNPLAGVSETVLGVQGAESTIAAIERCWSSLRSGRAKTYFEEFAIDPESLAVAVAVQAMVEARAAFVVFSADPVRAGREVVVTTAHGLGESLVQDRAEAVHHFVDSGNRVESHLAGDSSAPPLSLEEVRAVADLARAIAEEMGAAQDVEGAVDGSGRIWLLQSRPLSWREDRRRVFTSMNVSESFPGLSSPMTYSVAARFYHAAFRDSYRRFGVGPVALARESVALASMLGYIDGRIYYDITSFYQLHSLSPFFPLVRAGWERKVGLSTAAQTGTEGSRRERPGVRTLLAMVRSILGVVLASNRRMREFEAYWTERLPAAQRELDRLGSPMERIDHYYALWAQVSARWGVTLVNDTIANSLHGICTALLRPIAKDGVDGCLADLLTPPDLTLIESFWAECRRRMAASGAVEQERLLSDLLHHAGDRCITGLKLEEPSLAERIDWLRSTQGVKPSAAPRGARWKPSIFHPLRRLRWTLAMLLVRRLRRVIAHRENHRYLRSQLFAYCRRFARALATDLHRNGVIEDPGDVWQLSDTEAIGTLDGHGVDVALHAIVELRRQAATVHAGLDPPAEFTATGPVSERRWHRPRHPSIAGELVRGIGSSSGVVRGRALLLASAEDPPLIGRDTILIARTTDPSWTAVMAAAGGLVVERGSMLSHTAITGRMLGLPTVVCARDAVRLIPEGALVEVDGGAGYVRVIEPQAKR
jgi:rifampicin phosphotransferase